LLNLVGYLHRCTKMMHGQTNVKFNVVKSIFPDVVGIAWRPRFGSWPI